MTSENRAHNWWLGASGFQEPNWIRGAILSTSQNAITVCYWSL